MDFKIIVYIIIGVISLIVSMQKKKEDGLKGKAVPPRKTVQPPVTNPIEQAMREMKRRQAEAEAKKKRVTQTNKTIQQQKQEPELLVHEKRSTVFNEGQSNYESTYEPVPTAEDKIERGNIKLANEGTYRIETIEEAEAREEEENNFSGYSFNARQAFIGSIIFERRF